MEAADVSKMTFRQALNADMERTRHTEASLGKLMGISAQSVGNWKLRGFAPPVRVEQMIGIFGEGCALSKLTPAPLKVREPRVRYEVPGVLERAANLIYRQDHTAEFYEALPYPLRKNMRRPNSPDYVGLKVSAEVFVIAPGSRASASDAILLLLQAETPARVLYVVSESPAPLESLIQRHVREVAERYNVEIKLVASGREAAEDICRIEGDVPNPP